MPDVQIPRTSRYKDTPLFRNGKQLEFGLYDAPDEFFTLSGDFRIHVVSSEEVGFLDKIAVTYYGIGSEVLWWVIAQANDMVDPEAEMEPGQRLLIPSVAVVDRFASRDAEERV